MLDRKVKNLYRAIADEGTIEVLAITHPSTSTEFFVGWTAEGTHRLAVLRPGPIRAGRLEEISRSGASWTEEYRKYRDDEMNRRAYLFAVAGTLDPDLEAPFYGIWVAEEASLHRPGHDDFGTTRSDRRQGLCRGMYATADVTEVVAWLVDAALNAPVVVGRPESLEDEHSDLQRWRARKTEASAADRWVVTDPSARRVQDMLEPQRLYTMFPRDGRGRLKARQRVLVQPVSTGSDRDRRPWIVAVGPSRAGGQEISVAVEDLIAANQSHRFDLAPWCWRRGTGDLEDPRTWGYSADWDDRISLLLHGHIKEGLEAAGLRLDEAVSNLTRGSHIGVLHPDPAWPKVTRDRLARLAPWLLLGPGLDFARDLLKRKSEGLRLLTLPNQTAIRKASIVLVPGTPPSLEIRWTGTNARLPVILWERPPIPGVWPGSRAT